MRWRLAAGVLVGTAIASFLACSSFSEAPATTPTADSGPTVDAAPPETDADVDADAAALSAYRAAVLADNPIAYWRMSIATGSIVPDETGRGHTLSLSGGFTLGAAGATADGDDAVSFDGFTGSGVVDNPRDFDFTGGANFTIECFARRVQVDGGSTFRHMFSALSVASGYPGDGYQLYEALTGTPATQFEYDNGDAGFTTNVAVPPFDQWTHYAVVVNGGTITVYVNGAQMASKSAKRPLAARTSPVTVGRRSVDSSGYYAGDLDEIAIYDTALPPSRLAAHIDASKAAQ